jgi:hypothetical protein
MRSGPAIAPGIAAATRPNLAQPAAGEPPPPPLLQPGHGSGQRYAVTLSGTLVTLLVLCWLGSLAVAAMVGRMIAPPGGAGYAAGPAGQRIPTVTVAPPSAAPRHFLVLRTDRATPEARARFQRDAARLNEGASKRGWDPLFEVAEPANGQLQLVFGRQGVDKSAWEPLYRALIDPRAGYTQAAWVEMR